MTLGRRIFKTRWAMAAGAFLASLWVRFVEATSPTEYRNMERLRDFLKTGRAAIIVMWHSRCLFINKIWRDEIGLEKYPISGVFSSHRDGYIISKIYRFLGIGRLLSDRKSAVRARDVAFGCLRELRRGRSIGITPDGPRGPDRTFVTDSTFLFAKKTGLPIVPLYISANRAWRLKTWDRFMIIKPFSRSLAEAGDFVFVPPGAADADIEGIKAALTEAMRKRSDELDAEAAKLR
jgi:lysophospholipid acyltransferase (LPLAT)-like uncharacterized protein